MPDPDYGAVLFVPGSYGQRRNAWHMSLGQHSLGLLFPRRSGLPVWTERVGRTLKLLTHTRSRNQQTAGALLP